MKPMESISSGEKEKEPIESIGFAYRACTAHKIYRVYGVESIESMEPVEFV